MAKRNFAVDTTSMSTSAPLLENGVYAGVLANVSIKIGDNQTIDVVKEKKWDSTSKTIVETGEYIVSGRLQFGAVLTSKKAIKELQRDTPRVFGGQIFLNFDKEEYKLLDNHVLGAWLTALGLHEINFSESVDFEWNDDIEVPEELQAVPNIVDMLNSVTYYRAFFDLICNSANNLPARFKVVKQPKYKTPEVLENVIESTRDFCGILPYEDGCEEDLEEGE